MFRTSFAPTVRLLSSSPIPSKLIPLRRTKDPLRSSINAEHYILPSGSTFIVRPPPSTVPATMSIPQEAKGTTHASEHLLPPSRRPHETVEGQGEQQKLSMSEIEELQALRRSNPTFWTRSRLAQKFGLANPLVVGRLGWGKNAEGRRAEKQRQVRVEAQQQAVEARWGWKKTIAREERRRRRSMW